METGTQTFSICVTLTFDLLNPNSGQGVWCWWCTSNSVILRSIVMTYRAES